MSSTPANASSTEAGETTTAVSADEAARLRKHATLRYTAMRATVFVGCLVLVVLLSQFNLVPRGIGRSNPLWLVLLALVLSAPVSYVVLRRQRDAMSEQIVGGLGRAKEKLAANQSQEDDAA